jgi:radical SAM protein with 4Fe4S-binding SPASM domain
MPYHPAVKPHIQAIFAQKIEFYRRAAFLECELTTRCLNNCSYCGADIFGEQGEVDFDVLTGHLRSYARHARDHDLSLTVSLVGGDPLLYSRLEDLLRFLEEDHFAFFVKANASTLSQQRIEQLAAAGSQGVKLTCYGEPEVHDRHRGLDTYEWLVKRTAAARAAGLKVAWQLSVAKENLDSMRRLLPALAKLALDGIAEGRVGRIGRLAGDQDFADMTPAEWRAFLLDLLHAYLQHGPATFPLGFRDKLWVPLLVEEGLLDLEPFKGGGIQLGCDLFGYLATVDFRGYLKGCGLIESVGQRATFHPPRERGAVYFARDNMHLAADSVCVACQFADFCRGCRAMAHAHTGDPDGQDPHCWLQRATVFLEPKSIDKDNPLS